MARTPHEDMPLAEYQPVASVRRDSAAEQITCRNVAFRAYVGVGITPMGEVRMKLVQRIALIDTTGHILDEEVARVAAAIDVQVRRDVSCFWPVDAVITALPHASLLGPGVWPVFIVLETDDNSAGFHRTVHQQPYSEVVDGPNWSIAASHEILEMLVDPSGNRLLAAPAISVSDQGDVHEAAGTMEYLLEICDPSEDPQFAYEIDGVLVSDFYTPEFFDAFAAPGVRYSFRGAITHPRRVCPGGYLSWWNPAGRVMQRLDYVDHIQPKIINVGRHLPNFSLREHVDKAMRGKVRLSARRQARP
jgi:hypothetical protein